ncbi:MAG: hypothetical protein IPK97_00800 [Ahniella sp.]|nr:hypothetical protein [Ahniella sp.]
MKQLIRVIALAGAMALAGCGGGGSDGGANQPAQLSVAAIPASASTTPFSLVDVPIRVTNANGSFARDGTTVTVQVSPPGLASSRHSRRRGGSTTAPVVIGERVQSTTVGGNVNFRFHSRTVGTATLTVTAVDGTNGSATASSSTSISVVAGAPRDPRLTLTAATTTLPANRFNVPPFLGSPFLGEVAITWRRLNGELVTVFPTGRDNVVDVTVTPVLNTGGFCFPDDPETDDVDEFLLRLVTAPVPTNGGRSVVFLRSLVQPGTTTIQVAARDPDTDETVQAEITFNITNGTPRLPASVDLRRDQQQVYISGSGGNTSERFEAVITDGAGGLVADPVSGSSAFNNVLAEIVGGAQGAEKLSAVTASGATERSGSVRFRSFSGIAQFTYQSGTRAGTVPIRVTVDRADNNVDNGVQDPLTINQSLTVGDGRLFDLDITSPNVNSLRVNPFSVDVEVADDGVTITGDPDGTYSLTVAAIATDRFGQAVVPGTEIRFGLIDHPQTDGFFSITGGDGNPAEGGTSFVAPTGAFTTAGGGAGPGDTVLVFAEELNGNRDLESARTVASVNSQTSLTTTYRFNFNDDTGASVNNGPIFPYIIGRATDGNFSSVVPFTGQPTSSFGAAAFTDFNGVARVTMNYPVSKLGKLAAVFAQGSGEIVSNSAELVTDVELLRYAGLAPGTLVVIPGEIPGNRTTQVTACVADALSHGLQGLFLNFQFLNMNAATGRANGVEGPGILDEPTGEDGCVTVDVTTSGVVQPATGEPPQIQFSYGSANGSADIITGQLFLSASPESVTGDGGRLITLVLIDSAGNPVPGVLITGSCVANGGVLTITSPPGVTNAQGRTEAVASGSGFDVTSGAGSATGTCTFTVAGGTANDTVRWTSQNICDVFSPAVPEGCPAATLTVIITGTGTVGSLPAGISCNGPQTCTRFFAPTSSIQLSLSRVPSTFTCGPNNYGVQQFATVILPGAGQTLTCNVTFP